MNDFRAELQRAMTARGMSAGALADRIGYGRSNLRRVLDRGSLPTVEVASRMAEALDWEGLTERAVAARTGTCVLCGASFVRASRGHSRRFCSQGCKNASHMRAAREGMRRKVLTETRLTRKRLDDHQAAVAAFCRGCEPEGECRDSGCALRPVSPLRLASERRRIA